jgi:hypothetical protein
MRRPRFVETAALVALALGACSFDGSRGTEEGDAASTGDAGLDAPAINDSAGPRILCDGFQQIGASHYRAVDEMLSWNNAISRCRDFEGAHLVTFETNLEVTTVAAALQLTSPVWSAIAQRISSTSPSEGWTNRIGPVQTPVPQPFLWRGTEPNDGGGNNNQAELDVENFAELHPGAMFDDAPETRLSRPLCECTISP